MGKPLNKLIHKSARPGIFGPGVGGELPMTPGAIMDEKKAAKQAEADFAKAQADAQANVMPSADDAAVQLAKRRQVAKMRKNSGRLSTILADTGSLG